MKKYIILLLIGFAWITTQAQYTETVSFSKENISITKENGYDRIHFKNAQTTDQVGAPELPVVTKSYVLPYQAEVSGVVINQTDTLQLPGKYNVYPKQHPIIVGDSTNTGFTPPDPEVYNSSGPYPKNLIEVTSNTITMGYRVVTLHFYPLQYLPANQRLQLYTNMDFTIAYTLSGKEPRVPDKLSANRARIVKKHIQSMVENPEDFDRVNRMYEPAIQPQKQQDTLLNYSLPRKPGESRLQSYSVTEEIVPDYIIITSDSLKQAFQPLADWKTQKGMPAIIVTTEQIAANYPGIDLQQKIRNYLIEAYHKWGQGLFVLLGGDVNIIPPRYVKGQFEDNRPTDLYFSTIDNIDLTEVGGVIRMKRRKFGYDFYLGRASVENRQEAEIFVKKIKYYETLKGITEEYYVNNVMIAHGFKEGIDTGVYRDQRESLLSIDPNKRCRLFLHSHKDTNDFETENTRENVLKALNNKPDTAYYHIMYHMDHGGFSGIDMPSNKGMSLTRSDMDSLGNKPYYQILFTGSCDPNTFTKDCLGERFINAQGGGVAFIGNADKGRNTDHDQFNGFYHKSLLTDNVSKIGIAFQEAPNGKRQKLALHLLGDPEMPVWTATPDSFEISLSDTMLKLSDSSITLAVNNLPTGTEALVCLKKDEEAYTSKTIADTQEHIFYFDFDTPGALTVTITAPNYLPAVTEIPVNSSQPPNLFVSEVTTDDDRHGNSYGDNNHQADAGETIEWALKVKNSGGSHAPGVYAKTDAYCLLETFDGDLPSGWSITDVTGTAGEWTCDNGQTTFNASVAGAGTQTRLETPDIILNNSILTFSMYHNDSVPALNDTLQVQLNTDTGWINIPGARYTRYTGTPGWKKHTVDLSAYGSLNDTVQTGFLGISNEGADIPLDNIRITSPYITMLNDSVTLPDIPAGYEKSPDSVPYMHIHQNAPEIHKNNPAGNRAIIETVITCDSGSYSNHRAIDMYAPQLEQRNKFNITTGNGDTIIDPDEEVTFDMAIFNKGKATATGVTVKLSCTDPNVVCDTTAISYPAIEKHEADTNTSPFTFNTLPGYASADSLIFNATVKNEYGKQWHFSFDLLQRPAPMPVDSIHSMGFSKKINLWWAYPGKCKGYNIYRCGENKNGEPTGDYQKINTFILCDSLFTDASVAKVSNYYYRISAVSSTGAESSWSSPVKAWTSWGVKKDWPRAPGNEYTNYNDFKFRGNPIVKDIDGDGSEEIFVGGQDEQASIFDAILFGFNADASEMYDIDNNTTSVSGFSVIDSASLCEQINPAIGDINNDGSDDMIIATGEGDHLAVNKRKVFTFTDKNNEPQKLWKKHIGYPVYRGPVISDLNNSRDGKLEVIVQDKWGGPIHIYDSQGNLKNISRWKKNSKGYGGYGILSVADLDKDGDKELVDGFRGKMGVVGCDDDGDDDCDENNDTLIHDGGIHIWHHDGTPYTENPVFDKTNPYDNTKRHFNESSSPVIADLDKDGDFEIIFIAHKVNDKDGYVYAIHDSGSFVKGWKNEASHKVELPNNNDWGVTSPSVGDIINDEKLEIVVNGRNTVKVFSWDGKLLAEENNIPNFLTGKYDGHNNPILADVDEDDQIEIIVADKYIYGYELINGELEMNKGFPINANNLDILGVPCVSDIDDDGKNEIIAVTRDEIFVWETEGDADKIEWGSSRYNHWNTGTYGSYTKPPEKPVVTTKADTLFYPSEKVHSYTIHCYKEDGGEYTEYQTIDTKEDKMAVSDLGMEGLKQGEKSRIKVTANNNAGTSDFSAPVNIYLSSCGEKTVLDEPGDHQTGVDVEWWQTSDYLIAKDDFTVLDDQKVILTAKNVIHLKKGFHANKSGYFHAYIEDCSGSPNTKSLKNATVDNNEYEKPEEEEKPLNPEKNPDKAIQVELYPNPCQGKFNLSFANYSGIYTVEITDIMGVTVSKKKYTGQNPTINISHFPKGIYIVQIDTGEEMFNRKVVYE